MANRDEIFKAYKLPELVYPYKAIPVTAREGP
jgi:hypothetical protein